MNLLPIYTLIIFIAQKSVNSGEVTYYGDCKPPDGFTIGTYSTSSLLPIEKCCPQTDPCDEIQGSCTLKWALELWPRMCDHMTYDCKDFQCVCCVKCSEDKCSSCTETRGECKKECRPDEVEDRANPCSFAKCKCCKKCDIQPECQDAGGKCVGSYADCPTGSISSNTGCCGGCFCCKPACQPLPACSQVEGAYCSETEHCSGGFYACHGLCLKTKWKSGYEAIEKCYCCIPKVQGPIGSSRFLLAMSRGVPDTNLETFHNNFHINHIIKEEEQEKSDMSRGVPDTNLETFHNNFHINHIIKEEEQEKPALINEDSQEEIHKDSLIIPKDPRYIPIPNKQRYIPINGHKQ